MIVASFIDVRYLLQSVIVHIEQLPLNILLFGFVKIAICQTVPKQPFTDNYHLAMVNCFRFVTWKRYRKRLQSKPSSNPQVVLYMHVIHAFVQVDSLSAHQKYFFLSFYVIELSTFVEHNRFIAYF